MLNAMMWPPWRDVWTSRKMFHASKPPSMEKEALDTHVETDALAPYVLARASPPVCRGTCYAPRTTCTVYCM